MVKIISSIVFIITLLGCLAVGYYFIADADDVKNDDSELLDYEIPKSDIKVELITDENCVILSQNPIKISSGETVDFNVVFNDNYTFDSLDSENASYANGVVRISNCTENTTVNLSSKCIAMMYNFDIEQPDQAFGSVEYSVSPGSMLENTLVSVSAIPAQNQTFIGWSDGAMIVDGGKVLSYSNNYSFTLNSNVKLYPNFLTEGYSIIKYDLNGGTTADGASTSIITQFSPINHLCPNLIADDGTIVREGYTLLEFTENQDGSGTAINPGGLAQLPSEGGVLMLYAQWSEWTDADYFEYTVNQSAETVTITGYTGDAGELSIPAKIDGMPVTKIAANSILSKKFETLVIPSSILTMESGAFKGCSNFNTLYITDTFTSIPNDAFINCNKFQNLRLNAAMPPYFINYAESIGARFEVVLARDSDKPLILFVGGSSCLYGIKAEHIEAELDYKYQVLNCGTNAGGTGILYMEALSHFMRPGDIIVNVPEYGNNQMGGTEIVWRTFRATTSCYNLYRYLDFSKYTNFFAAMSSFNTDPEARAGSKPQSYETKCTSLTPTYCDLAGDRPPHSNPNFNSINVKATSISDTAIKVINDLHTHLSAMSIKYYFSCAPICDGATGTRSTAEGIAAYYQRLLDNLTCPVISNPENYRFANEEYNNSSYHLCTASAIDRSNRVIADLLAQFEKENA